MPRSDWQDCPNVIQGRCTLKARCDCALDTGRICARCLYDIPEGEPRCPRCHK